MRIVVTGSSGLLGSALVRVLRGEGRRVVSLVRRAPAGADEARWDPRGGEVDRSALDGADAVVHLAGAGLGDRRWTPSRRREIVASRVEGTRTLVRAMASLDRPPRVLLSGSAIGFYGDTGDRAVDETAPAGTGFLADLVRAWEAEAIAAEEFTRVVRLRTGLVQTARGGSLRRILPIFRLGLGAPLGSGRQYWSWITLHDWVGAVCFLLESEVFGPVNLTAPEPVTNAEYTRALGRAVRRPTWPIRVPGFALRAALGGFADEGVLIGQRVLPARLAEAGYAFQHPGLGPALRAVL
ncbi:TIGR01777 family oxidoreductase [Bailinhaonella thermotolerans]|uniref:TIGR01777 family protein n=1 Tax=Bailinhaonella thermotolerans TaxID=1070861 RepID=A0A3A4BJP5_9ACTN|nr:TIGR01777 family oxidoreductase [Bailinhaonella thermotolerans]RJL31452.1 TIGR01777 family protein [Bailinhaonella thermotolerans]